MSSLTRSLTLSALFLCLVAPSALCANSNDAATKSELAVRGYMLSGELIVFPAGEQQLPGGWSLVPEGSLVQGAATLKLQGLSEVITAGTDIVSIVSQSMPTGEGQLLLDRASGDPLGLGDLALVCSKDGWTIASRSTQWNGRPVFELPARAQAINWTHDGQFTLTAELQLSSTVSQELGLGLERMPIVGAITLLASPYFTPAEPLVANAPPVVAGGCDVIVSTVGPGLVKNGTVGAITAYSVATTSCNIGGADAIWLSTVNQHPVIGAQMYRLRTVNGSGRFEQIGMSWLKHGFCALDQPNCGSPYTPNGSCSWLGLFATDTYDTSLNGQQSNLGPRSEVQPWTGAYPYPYVLGAGASGNATYKRLQIQNADLDPAQNAGAKYWGEVVYITTDETLDSIRHNNYSHRLVQAGSPSNVPPGSSLTFSGGTILQVPAIQEWANNEAGVTLVNVDVPGDGRFILGYKVTDLGGGQHHYEYALFNMNSDRSGQAFEVPLQTSNTVSNVGFHDADYHSGEPYSLTDWTPTTTLGSNINWATQTVTANPNANALRWSTTYNFRFDSNGAPTPGNVTLTLFKSGTPTSISIPAEVPGSTCAPSNYCSASVTTNGCVSTLSATGTPSASATSGFNLILANAEGQKTGLFFYGQGATQVPWGLGSTSYKCVTSPTQRTPVVASGGTIGQCNGTFTTDWNAWRSANPGGLGSPFAAGQTYYAQCWFRDPPAVNATNLSDGLVYTLCP